jgi:hypothetical protein
VVTESPSSNSKNKFGTMFNSLCLLWLLGRYQILQTTLRSVSASLVLGRLGLLRRAMDAIQEADRMARHQQEQEQWRKQQKSRGHVKHRDHGYER